MQLTALSLALTRAGFLQFTPASLFQSGSQGVWYDPSDYINTCFEDSAGTIPITTPLEKPVGLMLDKSKGLVLGSELVTGAASAYTVNGTVSTAGNTVTATCTVDGTYGIRWLSSSVNNKWVTCTFEIVTNSASRTITFFPNLVHAGLSVGTTTGSKSFTTFAPSATPESNQNPVFFITGATAGQSFSVRLVSVREVPGNHAYQSTTTSRPTLSARYNLLTKTEDFSAAAWLVQDGATTTSNSITFSASGLSRLRQPLTTSSVPVSLTARIVFSSADAGKIIRLGVWDAALDGLSTGSSGNITIPANGLVTYTWPSITSLSNFAITNGTAGISQTITLASGKGADLRVANDGIGLPAYQRVNTASDYDYAGFPPYLKFDGTDDSMATGNIDFTGTDKMSVFAGVRKLSDSSEGIVCELSSSYSNPRTFTISAPGYASPSPKEYGCFVNGGVGTVLTVGGNNAPKTNVIEWSIDRSATPMISGRLNGSANTSGESAAGSTFNNYPLYIGRRGGTSSPFNGRIYSLIVCGKLASAAEIAATENWVNQKTRAFA